MTLYICEKPSVARDLAKHLGATTKGDGFLDTGKGVVITWCFGHLLEMAPPDAYHPDLARWSLEALPVQPA
ncbi:MAG: toprim domain-containing protein, partial [Gammaproteobacteria bacterium]|nr:toprim domain-containing protein [Gammaproteobacteria bacterium]